MANTGNNFSKVAYTPNEVIALGIVGSRTSLYRLVQEKRLRMTKRGRSSIFLAKDLEDFLALLSGNNGASEDV